MKKKTRKKLKSYEVSYSVDAFGTITVDAYSEEEAIEEVEGMDNDELALGADEISVNVLGAEESENEEEE